MTTFPEGAERTRALALYSAVASGGGSVGLVLGGMLTSWVSWRWGLFINVPVGIALTALALRDLPETARTSGQFDLVGAITSTLGMTALVYGFVRAAAGRLERCRHRRLVRRRRPPARRLRRDRAPRGPADHAAAPVRQPRALRRVRRPRPARRRHVRHVLLRHAVPAGRARLQRAPGRPRLPADVGRDVRGGPRRAALRRARRRRRAADRRRHRWRWPAWSWLSQLSVDTLLLPGPRDPDAAARHRHGRRLHAADSGRAGGRRQARRRRGLGPRQRRAPARRLARPRRPGDGVRRRRRHRQRAGRRRHGPPRARARHRDGADRVGRADGRQRWP